MKILTNNMTQNIKPILAASSLAVLLALSSPANAIVHDWFNDNVVDPVVDIAVDIYEFSEDTFNDAVSVAKSGWDEAAALIEGIVLEGYQILAEEMFDQWAGPLEGMAASWVTLAEDEPEQYNTLVSAIQDQNGPEIVTAIENIMNSMASYAGFDAIVQDFKDKGAGSLMVIVSIGGGTGVTAEFDIGIALDIDYVNDLLNQAINGESSTFDGAIASLFIAGGIQIGPAAGGGVDLVVGYHTSNPDGVYGPGLDLSIEGKAEAGGSAGISWDISQTPWQIVMGGIGIGAGAEVKAAIGPSYATVIGQICSDGSLQALVSECGTTTTTTTTAAGTVDIDDSWSEINVTDMSNPAVFVSAPSFNGSDAGVMRIKNVKNGSFSMQFQEWDYLNGTHQEESVDYMTLPEGSYASVDGSKWEIGSFDLSGTTDFKSITFNKGFASKPYLFLMIQTYNGSKAVTVRAKNVSNNGFSAALFEQDSFNDTGHKSEKVSYLAITPPENSGTGNFNLSINLFQNTIFQSTIVMISGVSVYEASLTDVGSVIGSHTYYLQEEQSKDDETSHTAETVHVLEINGMSFIQQVTSNGGDTTSMRRD